MNIIELSERVLGIEDNEVEVEYQSDTIGKYGLHFSGDMFELTPKTTNCLAQDKCGIPPQKLKTKLANTTVLASKNVCAPRGGCC